MENPDISVIDVDEICYRKKKIQIHQVEDNLLSN